MQDIKRGMNAHDRKGDSEGTYFNFFSVVYSQSNQIVHFILRKGENIWVMLIWSSLRMKSNGIISPSAHWHQGLFGYVGMWMSLYLVHMLKCLSGMHLALPAEYVSFSKGFDRELGNYSLVLKFSDVHFNNWGTVGRKGFSYIDTKHNSELFLQGHLDRK